MAHDDPLSTVTRLRNPLIAVVGPTASGKSEVAQRLAFSLSRSVMGADSMQIYKGMDIGTGKLAPGDRIVDHYGIDLVEVDEPYSATLYQTYARQVVEELDARGEGVVVCGGTGFYVRALIDDYVFPAGEQVGNDVRDRYNLMAHQQGAQAVWEELQRLDPESAQAISPNDVKRVVRALELYHEGKSYASQKLALSTIGQYYPAQFFGLSVEPEILVRRIDERVDKMFEDGFVGEVERLAARGLGDALTSRHAIGYEQVLDYLGGSMTLTEAICQMKVATHRYAKRQRTWFRKDRRIVWLDANDDSDESADRIVRSIEQSIARQGGARGQSS